MKTNPMLLLDTNIWMDYYVSERPLHREAVSFITSAIKNDAILLYAATTAKDLYYSLLVAFKRRIREENGGNIDSQTGHFINAYVWKMVQNISECATAVGCDGADIWLAEKYRSIHPDFEDNLIIAAAERAKADYLITNDEKLLRHCPVACADIHDALKLLELGQEA